MGPMAWGRLDGRRISDEYVIEKYSCGFDAEAGKQMLEELRVARKWNLTIEEFNAWMDQPTDDWAQKYFHDIHCDCKMGAHIDNIQSSMGCVGTAIVERKHVRGSDWPDHQTVSRRNREQAN
jgi:hypothetical protein